MVLGRVRETSIKEQITYIGNVCNILESSYVSVLVGFSFFRSVPNLRASSHSNKQCEK